MTESSTNGSAFTDLILEVSQLNGFLLEAGDRLAHPVGLSSAAGKCLALWHINREQHYRHDGVQYRDGSENEENCPDIVYEWRV